MSKKHHWSFILIFTCLLSVCKAQDTFVYKQIDTLALEMQVYRPSVMNSTQKYPCMVFFFGGGWKNGSIDQFRPHAKYFSKRGLICFLVDYRVESRQGTTPFESLKDAKSAIRQLRANADNFQIDPDKIIASGGSAGGHLAAATALIEDFNEISDDRGLSAKPNALVLFNPVIDNGPGGYGYERIDEAYKDFSPLHNIKKGAPPTILFLGTADALIPVETANYYRKTMQKTGSRCDLHLFEGEGHGFFNYGKIENYKETISKTDLFLQSLGYLKKEPNLKID